MKSFPGTPGTFTGLSLRICQCLSAAGSIAAMANANRFEVYTAYCYLLAAMGLQVIWSLLLACLDIFALVKKTDFHLPIMISLFTAGDWVFFIWNLIFFHFYQSFHLMKSSTLLHFLWQVTATLSLSGVSAAAGITLLFDRDLGYCNTVCRHYQLSIALGSISLLMVSFSALIMFWILSAG